MGNHLEFLQQMKETFQIEDEMKYETKLKKFTGKMPVFQIFYESVGSVRYLFNSFVTD